MHQAQSGDPQPRRKAVGAVVAALLAIAALPAGAAADGLTVPHAAGSAPPTVPKAVGSGTPTPAPSPSPSPTPSSDSGGSSTAGSDFPGSGTPNEFGIPNFEFPKPDQPPSGSPQCGPGCEEQWLNYDKAAAQAADKWANETTDPDEAETMGNLADSLWSKAANAYERRNDQVNNAADSSTNAAVSSPAPDGAGQESDEDVPPDAVPLGWLVPGESDLTGGFLEGAIKLLEALPGLLGGDGTTACAKEETPEGEVPICAK